MKLEYKLEENDYLTYQLFGASKSPGFTKKRKSSNLFIFMIFLIIAVFYFIEENLVGSILFIIVGALWYFLYPIWEKRRLLKSFKNHVNEVFKYRFGKFVTVELENDFIFTKDYGSETKMLTSELEEISEISSLLLLKLKDGQSLIIPKHGIAQGDIPLLVAKLKEIANHVGVNYELNEKWEWK